MPTLDDSGSKNCGGPTAETSLYLEALESNQGALASRRHLLTILSLRNIHLKDLDATESFAKAIESCIDGRLVLGLVGNLGCGKTTLTQLIARQLGIQEEVCSPTFLMLNEYHSGKMPLYHFDLYRMQEDLDPQSQACLNLKSEFDEIMESARRLLVVIEWVDLWNEFCSDYDELRLEFKHADPDGRYVNMSAHGKGAEKVLACCQEKITQVIM